MSKLDELIAEYCPDGVEHRLVGEVCDTIAEYASAGSFADIAKNVQPINNGKGYAQLIRTTDLKSKFGNPDKFVYVNEHAFQFLWRVNLNREALIMPNIGNCGEVYYITPDIFPEENNVLGPNAILVRSSTVNNRFLYHLFLSKEFQAKLAKIISQTGQKKFNKTNFKKITIPVPPLPVQEEIVRILDSFTQLTSELQTELQARKQQYRHYLNYLFENQTDNLVPLDSLGSLKKGKRFTHADATDTGVPCIHYGELYTYYGVHADTVKSHIREELRSKMRYAHKGDVIIVGAGENNTDIGIGVAWEGDEDVAVHDVCYTLCHSQNSKYISYYLRSDMYHNQIKKYVSEGKICSISATGVGKALIPIPSIEEQQRIVAILERFDMLCNDITTGLPAEIERRIKQYEFYRDKLLSFNI